MTIDKRRDKRHAKKRTAKLLDFVPVPRRCQRHDGWTPERQKGFIAALADSGSVKSACLAVNMASEGAYQLRRHPEAAGFAKAWQAALALGVQRLEDIAMERALNGVEVPVYSYGKLVGTRVVHNDRLLMFLLRSLSPKRFASGAAKGPHAAQASNLKRLKREWLAEWEAEQEAAKPSEEEVIRSINAKLERRLRAQKRAMSPRTLRLQALLEDSQRIDRLRRARRDILSLPKWAKASLYDGVQSHPSRAEVDEHYLEDEIGTLAAEEAEHAHHRAKLERRGGGDAGGDAAPGERVIEGEWEED